GAGWATSCPPSCWSAHSLSPARTRCGVGGRTRDQVRPVLSRRWRRATACLVLAVAVLAPASAWAGRPLALGFTDTTFSTAAAGPWFQRSAAAGADMVRIDIGWPVANTATRPVGFDPRNPVDPHYDFTGADNEIKQAVADGLEVLVV